MTVTIKEIINNYEFFDKESCGFVSFRKKDGSYGWINPNNGEVLAEGFTKTYDFEENLGIFERNGTCGFMNTEGKVIAEGFLDAYDLQGGLAPVQLSETSSSWIDKDGILIGKSFYITYSSEYGYFLFENEDDTYGILNKNKEIVINGYESIDMIDNNKCIVKKSYSSSYALLDLKSNKEKKLPFKEIFIHKEPKYNSDVIIASIKNKYFLIDKDCNPISKKYDYIDVISSKEGLLIFKKNYGNKENIGVLDLNGNVILKNKKYIFLEKNSVKTIDHLGNTKEIPYSKIIK